MEKDILVRVSEVWDEICPCKTKPVSMVWMKVQGKNTPKGCIVLMVLDEIRHLPVAIVKIPRTPEFTEQIELEFNSINAVNKLIMDKQTKAHVPSGAVIVSVAGKKVLIESACDGHPMVREFLDSNAIKNMSQSMVDWQIEFSKATNSNEIEFTTDNINKHVTSVLKRLKETSKETYELLSPLSVEYFTTLESKLEGKKLKLVQQHGDFNAYNILVNMSGDTMFDFSVIDWEDYSVTLPIFDINHFFICNSNLVSLSGSATDKYKDHIINSSWYQDMYINSVDKYIKALALDEDVYWMLTPLYFIEMANRVFAESRQQGETAPQWISWGNEFIEKFPKIKR
ncbi:MAG: phosphotransferase [Pseudomonadota bacterium]